MTLIEILLLIIALALSIIAVRVSFKCDINKYLENRRKVRINQLKNACPHGTMRMEEDKLIFESFFESPSGTMNYICNQCGLIVSSDKEIKRITEPLLKNPNKFIKRQETFIKVAKILKIV